MDLDIFITTNLQLLKVGGAMTGKSNLLAKRFFNSTTLTNINKDVVIMSLYLKQGLSPLEFNSIYYHEIGHYVKGHQTQKTKSISWRDKELEADAYSVHRNGAKNLLTALEKIPDIIRRCQPLRDQAKHLLKDEDYYRELNIFLENINKQMYFRYQALKKLI